MRRRSHLAITLVALLMVGTSIVSSSPRDPAQAADPLSDAIAQQKALRDTLAEQRAALKSLQATSTALAGKLDTAKAELASVTAEWNRVSGLLVQVQAEVAEIGARLEELLTEIAKLDEQMSTLAAQIRVETAELDAREALLQEHLRSAYESTQTSLLEILLSADSLDAATNQVGYLLTVSEQDRILADQIRDLRAELKARQQTLLEGRAVLADARDVADAEAKLLAEREAELAAMEANLADLKAAADQKRRDQEAALNAALNASGNVEAQIKAQEEAFAAATKLVDKLIAESRNTTPSSRGFRWPEDNFRVTQEWGPTSFWLEPPYTYKGTWYPHFHGGIDLANGCGTAIKAAGNGVIVATGRPLWPWDSAYGVVIDHGGGVMTWYWHLQSRVIVSPGQSVSIGQTIGYEGTTGNSTGCHLHFAVNDRGVWENPRFYLP
jgi:murein DD-endopeptidase MepM/ murein hydrolase activator NlpD